MRRKINETVVTPVETTAALHIKYRPTKLAQVIGQKAVVKSLLGALTAKARNHAFMFTGPKGTGKTTLARITAAECGIDAGSLVEVDAASKSGVDDVRELTSLLRYNGFGDTPNKGIIIDECHRLSKQAWDALLKPTEDTPPHVFFFFCSTEPEKIPETIASRCVAYNLRPVPFDDIMDLLEDVCEGEGYDTPARVLSKVAQACEGSPRAALTMLAAVHDSSDEDVDILLAVPTENKEVIDLCRMMMKRELTWPKLTSTLKSLNETPPETIRILIVNYLNACAMGAKDERDAVRVLDMLGVFLRPTNPADKLGPILAAFGRLIFD